MLFTTAVAAIAAAVLLFPGCSQHPSSGSPRLEIDAVLPAPGGFTLLRLGGQRYARIPAALPAWADTAGPAQASWKAVPSPEGSFRPVQALSAARGYFYLVDAASSRLCLYDSAFGLISTYPLPDRFTPFASGRAAVFRGADGAFLFADYAAGEAFLYADREGTEGARSWMLRARTKMPVGWRDCFQQPGSEEISCSAGGGAVRFDGALNRLPAGGARAPGGDPALAAVAGAPPTRLFWDPATREWVLEGQAPDRVPLFHFHPAHRRLDRVVPQ